MAATKVRAEDINFMAKYGRGLICLTLTRDALRAAAPAVDGQQYRRSADHEFHDLDRGGRRRDDGHLGARSRAHDSGGGRAERAAERSASAGPHLSADGAARRRADARRAYGSRLRPRAARGRSSLPPSSCEILNDDGAMARRDDLLEFARRHDLKIGTIADLIEYRLRTEAIRGDHRRHRCRDRVRCVPAGLLRGPRESCRAFGARAREARREDADARARAPAGHVERRARACIARAAPAAARCAASSSRSKITAWPSSCGPRSRRAISCVPCSR